MKRFYLLQILCVISGICLAQTPNDSALLSFDLGEVVIEAPQIIQKVDRDLYIPKKSMISQSTDATDLLARIKLPEVYVNRINGTIALMDNGKITVCINGRPVEQEQVNALRPEYIKRIEYHSNPSMRWGDAKKVIDFITKNPDTGGNTNIKALQSVNKLGYEEFEPNFNLYSGKSEFRASAKLTNIDGFECYRENIETFKTSNNVPFRRIETGIPRDYNKLEQNYSASYSYNDSVQLFEIYTGHRSKNRTSIYEGDIFNDLTSESVFVKEQNRISSNNQSKMVLYYHRMLPHNQMIISSVGANYLRTNSKRLYTENEKITETTIRENGFRTRAELNYQKQWKFTSFITGISTQQSYARTKYPFEGKLTKTSLNNTNFFAEILHSFGKNMDIAAGASLNYYYTKMDGYDKVSGITLHPKIRWHWKWSKIANLNASIKSYTNPPNVSQISPVIQVIDTYQATMGNPDISNSHTLNFGLEQDFAFKKLYLQVGAQHVIHYLPIMEEKFWNEDKTYIITSYDNHKPTHETNIYANIRLNAIKNWVYLGGNVRYLRILSRGNHYEHDYDNLAYQISASISHWGFNLQWEWHKQYNNFWGEIENGDNTFNVIFLDYKVNKKWHVAFLAMNPFSGKYYNEKKDLNSLAGYSRKNYCNAAENLFGIQVTWVTNWGNKKKNRQTKYIQDNNLDGSGTTAIGK